MKITLKKPSIIFIFLQKMNKIQTKFKRFQRNPLIVFAKIWEKASPWISSDELFLKVDFFLRMHKKLNLKDPQTFNEKLQWLKLFDQKKEYSYLVDKYEVREFVAKRIGEQHLIPLLGVYNNVDEIDFNSLPEKFVLKPTHDSGSIIICKDKAKLNVQQAKQKLSKCLNRNYFLLGREYPYKNVKRRIIAEQFMEDENNSGLNDYKFFCFNGKPRILFFASDRYNSKGLPPKFDYYDMEMNPLNLRSRGHETSINKLSYFPEFNQMIEFATILSKGIPFVRADFYLIKGQVYFGELTFFHDGGIVPFEPKDWDYKLGEMLCLPEEKTLDNNLY